MIIKNYTRRVWILSGLITKQGYGKLHSYMVLVIGKLGWVDRFVRRNKRTTKDYANHKEIR